MLELALFFLGMAFWAPSLGPQYADVGMMALRISEVLFVTLIVIGALALAFQRPIERRVLHHA